MGRPKKVNIKGPKRNLKIREIKDNVGKASLVRLFNAAAEFVSAFLEVGDEFVSTEASDSTETHTTKIQDDDGESGRRYVSIWALLIIIIISPSYHFFTMLIFPRC